MSLVVDTDIVSYIFKKIHAPNFIRRTLFKRQNLFPL